MCVQLETCVELASSLRRVVPSGSCWSTVYCSTQPWRKLSLSAVVSKRRPLELAAGGFKVTKNSLSTAPLMQRLMGLVLVGPALTLAIRKEKSIKIRITCAIQGGDRGQTAEW